MLLEQVGVARVGLQDRFAFPYVRLGRVINARSPRAVFDDLEWEGT
jgi:hypothetical protein